MLRGRRVAKSDRPEGQLVTLCFVALPKTVEMSRSSPDCFQDRFSQEWHETKSTAEPSVSVMEMAVMRVLAQ